MNQRTQPFSCLAFSNMESNREALQGKASRKSDRRNCFLIRAILMVKKIHAWKSKAYSKKKKKKKNYQKIKEIFTLSDNYYQQQQTIFQISYQTILALSWSCSQTILHTFPDIKQYWHFQRVTGKELLHQFPEFIKQCWPFQRVSSKLNYSKNFFQSTYHTIMTLSRSYYQAILTYSELISNSQYSHFHRVITKQNIKHFFESLNAHLNRQKILKR